MTPSARLALAGAALVTVTMSACSTSFDASIANTTTTVAVTTTLNIGSLVLAADFRHPVVLARELATIDLLSALNQKHGKTIVMVTHDPGAASYADRVLFLADGRIVDEMAQQHATQVELRAE